MIGQFLANRLFIASHMRKPDAIIGGTEDPYMLRWWIIPRNRFFNIYGHQFLRSDDDRALHDHPWLFNISYIAVGRYIEHTKATLLGHMRSYGTWKFRWGKSPHRVELLPGPNGSLMPCWTIFITGPVVREWGFYCPKGWVHWKVFTNKTDDNISTIGRGCE